MIIKINYNSKKQVVYTKNARSFLISHQSIWNVFYKKLGISTSSVVSYFLPLFWYSSLLVEPLL